MRSDQVVDGCTFKPSIKSKKVVHGDNGGEWACNQTGCKQWRHCNRHDKCPVQLSIRGTAGSQYWNIYVTEGVAHTLTPKAYARRNSPLSFEEAAQVQGWVEGGKKPKQMKELVQRKRIAQSWQFRGARHRTLRMADIPSSDMIQYSLKWSCHGMS